MIGPSVSHLAPASQNQVKLYEKKYCGSVKLSYYKNHTGRVRHGSVGGTTGVAGKAFGPMIYHPVLGTETMVNDFIAFRNK
jgi:hypothetical protein